MLLCSLPRRSTDWCFCIPSPSKTKGKTTAGSRRSGYRAGEETKTAWEEQREASGLGTVEGVRETWRLILLQGTYSRGTHSCSRRGSYRAGRWQRYRRNCEGAIPISYLHLTNLLPFQVNCLFRPSLLIFSSLLIPY